MHQSKFLPLILDTNVAFDIVNQHVHHDLLLLPVSHGVTCATTRCFT